MITTTATVLGTPTKMQGTTAPRPSTILALNMALLLIMLPHRLRTGHHLVSMASPQMATIMATTT